MGTSSFSIAFPDTSSGQANRWAGELKEAMLDADPSIQVAQKREHTDTMDLGSILQIALGSAVLVQAIKTLEAWLVKRRDCAIELSDGKRSLKISGVPSETALAQIKAFFEQSAAADPHDA